MTTGPDDEYRRDERDDDALDSPFRRLTATGEPAWHSPPRPEPVDAYGPAPATIAVPPSMPDAEYHASPATSGSRFRFSAIFGLLGGVFLLTAVAVGAYAAYQALLGHEDRVTAAYAPADSWAYLAVNVDPTSHAWLDAWNLAKEAGIDDELSRLPTEGLAESGEDPASWETLIKPAIGRELGFAVWPNPAGADAEPSIAAIVMVEDEQKAREALDALLDEDAPADATYRDVTYQVNDDDTAAGFVDEALIVASTSAAFEEIVDARRDGALDQVADFTAAADRAADNPLVFAYVNGASIAEAAASIRDEISGVSGEMVPGMWDMSGTYDVYADLGQITLTIRAEGSALQTEVLTEGRPDSFPMTPAGTVFAAEMPASTLFYVASADLYGTVWQPAMAQLEAIFGASSSDGMGMMPSPDDIGVMLGFDLEGGLLAQLTGPYAMSVSVEEAGGEYGGQFHFFSEVNDPATVEETLDEMVESLAMGMPVDEVDGGYRVDVPEEEIALELTVVDDVLHLSGSYRASDAAGTLADDESFQAAMDAMPENPTLAGYLATDRIWNLLPAVAWEEAGIDMRTTLEAFGPMAWAIAPDGDGTRTLFVMTVGQP